VYAPKNSRQDSSSLTQRKSEGKFAPAPNHVGTGALACAAEA
jgi:hypothetical protein